MPKKEEKKKQKKHQMGHLLLVHEAHKLPMDHSALIPPHIKCSCPLLAMRCCQPPPAMRHRRTNLVASTPSGFLLLDATSGFFLTIAAAKSRYAVADLSSPKPRPSSPTSCRRSRTSIRRRRISTPPPPSFSPSFCHCHRHLTPDFKARRRLNLPMRSTA
jgi:hypothetical protein